MCSLLQVKVCREPLSDTAAVAYIKFRRASAAAAAIETMHEAVLNDGRGPLLKVMLAEAPNSRCAS